MRIAGRTDRWGQLRRVTKNLADEHVQPDYDFHQSRWARKLPATVVHALHAPPENSPNTALLQQLAEVYSTRVRDRCNWSTSFIGQITLIGLGLLVGIVVLALYLPLLDLINGLTG